MKKIDVVSLVVGLAWFAIAASVVLSRVILRKTRLGVIAWLLDRLPSAISTPIFLLLWLVLPLGWLFPVGFSLRRLLSKQIPN